MSKPIDKSKQAAAKFFLRIGQVQASRPWRDEWTDYLFPLPLILDAEGTLADDAKHLVGKAHIDPVVERKLRYARKQLYGRTRKMLRGKK